MSMFNVFRKEIEWGGRTLVLETGKIARQADGAVMATLGGTTVLCAVVAAKKASENLDFFPLTVHYIEKFYAGGKVPGGFFKREGRPTEKETLTARLIDRPIRPLFEKGFKNETQVICTVVSYDGENDPDMVAMIAASAALTISGLPFKGPIASARIGYKDGEYILNPCVEDVKESDLELVVAGTKQGVLMVESQANELSEEIMLGAVTFGHEQMQSVIDAIIGLAELCAKDMWEVAAPAAEIETVRKQFDKKFASKIAKAYKETKKQVRVSKLAEVREEAIESLGDNEAELKVASNVFKAIESDIVRSSVLKTGMRIDGRDTKTVRPIECQVDFLDRTHGSALFTRGETQALVVTAPAE